jgi:hypothetical protein
MHGLQRERVALRLLELATPRVNRLNGTVEQQY